jgi:hypothetical protein
MLWNISSDREEVVKEEPNVLPLKGHHVLNVLDFRHHLGRIFDQTQNTTIR